MALGRDSINKVLTVNQTISDQSGVVSSFFDSTCDTCFQNPSFQTFAASTEIGAALKHDMESIKQALGITGGLMKQVCTVTEEFARKQNAINAGYNSGK